jgi:hypothetical protein
MKTHTESHKRAYVRLLPLNVFLLVLVLMSAVAPNVRVWGGLNADVGIHLNYNRTCGVEWERPLSPFCVNGD